MIAEELRGDGNALVPDSVLDEIVQGNANTVDLFVGKGGVRVNCDLKNQAAILQGGLIEENLITLFQVGSVSLSLYTGGRCLSLEIHATA